MCLACVSKEWLLSLNVTALALVLFDLSQNETRRDDANYRGHFLQTSFNNIITKIYISWWLILHVGARDFYFSLLRAVLCVRGERSKATDKQEILLNWNPTLWTREEGATVKCSGNFEEFVLFPRRAQSVTDTEVDTTFYVICAVA